ncbi:hypothetical protein ACFO3O_11780 [Dokdonia ponticola]|uniref:Uncharacterized protein n=1 Tax=Dokdonia ponticola TaxID=2041041 RepID=A0ABV9HYI1_9FLAO
MKTLQLIPLFLIAFLCSNFTAVAQEEEEDDEEIIEEGIEQDGVPTTVTAVYLGFANDVYTFSFKNEDGDEDEITFEKISEDIKKSYDLTTKDLVGKTFILTFSQKNVPDPDDEDILTSVNTLISLKKV